MRRACKITLQYCTKKKLAQVQALLEAYRGAVNFFIRSLWQTTGSLDKITLARLPDAGIHKLLATSDGEFYGTDFRAIRDKVKRRRPGSHGKRRARAERDQYINRTVKQLPWHEIRAIGYEDLTGMKRGKGARSKNFRKAAAPWSYRQVRQRIELLAQENRVRPVAVDPRGTSRTCPLCNTEDRRNRKGENFRCIACDYRADADYVGSLNILARTTAALGRVESPRHQCH